MLHGSKESWLIALPLCQCDQGKAEHSAFCHSSFNLTLLLPWPHFFSSVSSFSAPLYNSTTFCNQTVMASTDEFWKICNDDGVCHCDWRLTIYGCEEEQQLRAMYIALAVLSGLVGVFGKPLHSFVSTWSTLILTCIAFMVLYHRVVYLKQQIFDMRTGYPRPKPIESMAVFGTIFNLRRYNM